MSELVAVAYRDEDTADRVLNKLQALGKEHLVDLADACVVVRDADGRLRLKQAVNLPVLGAASGATWGGLFGTLIGLLFVNPLVGLLTGAALGAGGGALSGKLSDYGIDDDFMRSVGSTLERGSSALFVLVRKVSIDKVLPELQPFGGTVLRTSLSNEQEARLREALDGAQRAGTLQPGAPQVGGERSADATASA